MGRLTEAETRARLKPWTDAEIRARLLAAADDYMKRTGASRSGIGKRAVNDPNFLYRVAHGKNFTIANYQAVVAFITRGRG